MLCLRPLVLVLSLAATVANAGTLTTYVSNMWKNLREKLSAPVMQYFYYPDRVEVPPAAALTRS